MFGLIVCTQKERLHGPKVHCIAASEWDSMVSDRLSCLQKCPGVYVKRFFSDRVRAYLAALLCAVHGRYTRTSTFMILSPVSLAYARETNVS